MEYKYDFLIVGAGLYGATCARLLTDKGYKCLIIERDSVVGGMTQTDRIKSIDVHKFGPHIFHTSYEDVWSFVNKYADMKTFNLNVLAYYNENIYHLPINLTTFYELFHTHWPIDAQRKLQQELDIYGGNKDEAENIEDYALSHFGNTIYNTLIKSYTEKQWNTSCRNLPKSIIERIPMRFNYDNNYFDDKYVAIPNEGYTKMVENIIGDDIDIMLNKDFIEKRDQYLSIANYIIYTGPIDEFCEYKFGPLSWRSLKFEINDETPHGTSIIGTPIVNFTGHDTDWTRIIEHKWFTPWRKGNPDWDNNTILTYEYPDNWEVGKLQFYPIENTESLELYKQYKKYVATEYNNILFAGRLGSYKYVDMDDTIKNAIDVCSKIKKKQI